MNKIFNINLGGYAFTIDEDAYEHLCKYLDTIHNHFRASEGYEDITSDIETRMAELMQESIQGRQIVMMKDVRTAISIMGTPEEFGAVSGEDEDPLSAAQEHRGSGEGSQAGNNNPGGGTRFKTGKRLMRNPEDKVIEGVCSGIAAYFGIQDAVWIRLAFVGFAFAGGSAVFLYIILWAIMKKAKTPADFLAMRGEPINVNNIARMVEREFDSISDSFSQMGDKKKRSGIESGLSNFLSKLFSFGGQILHDLLRFLGVAGGKIATIIGVLCLIPIIGAWIFLVFAAIFGYPILSFVLPGSGLMKFMTMLGLFIFIVVPTVALLLALLQIFFKTRIRSAWHFGMWGLWSLAIALLVGIASKITHSFNIKETVSQGIPVPSTDSLVVGFLPNPYSESMIQLGSLRINENKLASDEIYLEVKLSKDGQYHLEKVSSARGVNREEARRHASSLEIPVTMQGGQINLATFFELKERESFQGQSAGFVLYVPENKTVTFLEAADHLNPDGDFDYDRVCENTYKTRVYKMEKGLMHCISEAQAEEAPAGEAPAEAPAAEGQPAPPPPPAEIPQQKGE